MREAKMRNLNHRNRPSKAANVARSAAFAAALLGSTIMGCGARQKPAAVKPPQAETQQPKEKGIKLGSFVISGKGSKQKPYTIDILENKRTFDTGSIIVETPLTLRINEGDIHFRVKLNVSQLREDKIVDTEHLLRNIMRGTAREHYYRKGMGPGIKIEANIMKGLRDMAAKAAQADAEVRDYLTEVSIPKDEKISITYFIFVIEGKRIPCQNVLMETEHELKEGDRIEDVGRIDMIGDEDITINVEATGRDVRIQYGETLRVDGEFLNYVAVRPEKNENAGRVTMFVEVSGTICAKPPSCNPGKKKFQNTQI